LDDFLVSNIGVSNGLDKGCAVVMLDVLRERVATTFFWGRLE
jgi:hypothetical protein